MNRKIKVVFAADNPGGMDSIKPVYEKMGGKIFSHKDILSNEEIEKILKSEKPDFVLCGTSLGNESLDKRFTRIAKKIGIPCAAVLDFWVNYKVRFINAMPDKIFVMDEFAKDEMIKEGFNPDMIVVTGNPHFDSFKELKSEGDFAVFFSQPFSELENNLGMNEFEILKDIEDVWKKLKIDKDLKIKLHPTTKNREKYEEFLEGKFSMTEENAKSLIDNSFLVIGMNSMALFEASVCGRKTLSYQPGLNIKDPLITNKMGISKAVYKKEDLADALKKLIDEKPLAKKLKMVQNATENVVLEINKMV